MATPHAADVDAMSLAFGPYAVAPLHDLTDPDILGRHLRDADADDITDLITHYSVSHAGIDPADSEACLRGTIGGESFRACDAVIPICEDRQSKVHFRQCPMTQGSQMRGFFSTLPCCLTECPLSDIAKMQFVLPYLLDRIPVPAISHDGLILTATLLLLVGSVCRRCEIPTKAAVLTQSLRT